MCLNGNVDNFFSVHKAPIHVLMPQSAYTGDVRANEQPGLTSMHTIFVRLHNYFERHMYRFNKHLSSEELFQVQVCINMPMLHENT